ncbi:DUF1801 domain-containing protein [Marinilongibacter aquaticus]|uniref:DUF1801 domain-containing protein n=1 Tax=Marinilongibacter aquaticus TaxID=2975157 RepID=UPI0021BD7C7B|nr:DUF1801 domain-containing protein [Marinilongibacter aquaticus]UBM58537.1 DUF1801 domain-containing protein [Marinilongibacter aquaticus]
MAQAENKTKETEASVAAFLEKIEDPKRKTDSLHLFEMMNTLFSEEAKMWGPSIVGYGSYHYKYESGREGDMPKIGFSPRKNALTLYIMPGFARYEEILQKLGKFKTGKSCLYIKKLEDIDEDALCELMKESHAYMSHKYG